MFSGVTNGRDAGLGRERRSGGVPSGGHKNCCRLSSALNFRLSRPDPLAASPVLNKSLRFMAPPFGGKASPSHLPTSLANRHLRDSYLRLDRPSLFVS